MVMPQRLGYLEFWENVPGVHWFEHRADGVAYLSTPVSRWAGCRFETLHMRHRWRLVHRAFCHFGVPIIETMGLTGPPRRSCWYPMPPAATSRPACRRVDETATPVRPA